MKLYSVEELAQIAGVGIYTIRARIWEMKLPPADFRIVRKKKTSSRVNLYPKLPELVESKKSRDMADGWFGTTELAHRVGARNDIMRTFLMDMKAEMRTEGKRFKWRLPESIQKDADFRHAWVDWTTWRGLAMDAAKAASKGGTEKTEDPPPVIEDDPDLLPGVDWLMTCPLGIVRDMVLDERKKRKMIGGMVRVNPENKPPYIARLLWYNCAGFAVRMSSGRVRQYVARQAKVQILTKKEVEDAAEV